MSSCGGRAGLTAAFFAASLVALAPRIAAAQSVPQVSASVDPETVGVGETFQVEIQATSPDAMPSSVDINPPAGLLLRGKNSSPMQQHTFMNGTRSDQYTLTSDWAFEATRVGSFALPGSVVVGTKRYSVSPLHVRVVPAGQAPARKQRQNAPPSPFGGFSPFDPWKQLFGGAPNSVPEPPPQRPEVSLDPKLSIDAPRGDTVFLHATVDKTTAVVGEQVTLSVYQYIDITPSGDISSDDMHFPDVVDFVKRPLVGDNQDAPVLGYASTGGRVWQVRLFFRWALFPLRAGDLTIGPTVIELIRGRSPQKENRSTESFRVRVTEPPLAGRPPGYAIGDVGRFALAAQVQPRQAEQGGAVGVHVDLSGTGNVPATVTPPAREGLEWLAPDVHEAMGPTANGTQYGGKRSFDFVVHVNRAGDVDLGELALPYWDPDQRRYSVARAPLGTIHVTANAAAAAKEPDKATEVLAGLPAIRTSLEGTPAARAHPDDSPWFWVAAIAGGPLAFGLSVGLSRLARRVAAAWELRRTSPASELKERLSAAREACVKGDARAADSAIGRALEAAAMAHAGVNVRGAVGRELTEKLERAGVAADAATNVAELLRECEAARFSPDAAELAATRERWSRAQAAIARLERRE
ncbi:MAG TPA: BatD family protein [Polyangiaceae bacterium]|nr:BatD family protein [Polyangiaceae bacterium]